MECTVAHMPSGSSEAINQSLSHSPLDEARELLQYWRTEHANSVASKDERRAERCSRFVKQCELVVAALEHARAAGERQSDQ